MKQIKMEIDARRHILILDQRCSGLSFLGKILLAGRDESNVSDMATLITSPDPIGTFLSIRVSCVK